jgi:uncharacterized protein
MYIEQLNTKKFTFLPYIPIPLLFIGLIAFNSFATQKEGVEEAYQVLIEQFGQNLTFVFVVAPLSIACLFLFFWVKFIHQQSIRSLTTSREKVDWHRILFSFILWGSVSAFFIMVSVWTSPENFVFQLDPIKFGVFVVLALLLLPLQTSFEEYLFRGYLMQGIGVLVKNRGIPLVLTSVFFGLMHLSNPEVGKMGSVIMVYYIGTGFFLGMITLLDEGLELALGFHAANNIVGALLVTADWTALQTPSVYKDISEPSAHYDVLLPVLVLFPILLFIFGRKYKWSHWKQKLMGTLPPANY